MDRKWTMNEMDRVTRCSFNPAVNKRTVWLPLWKGGGGHYDRTICTGHRVGAR